MQTLEGVFEEVGGVGLVFGTHLQTYALLVDARHDEVDELALIGITRLGGAGIDVFTIETTVPDEVLIGAIVSREAELEDRRTILVTQIDGFDALAAQLVLHQGVAGTGRHIDVAELRRLKHIGHVGHDVVTAVDGVSDTALDARIQEVVLTVVSE